TGVNRLETLSVSGVIDAHLGLVQEARSKGELTLEAAERFEEPLALIRSFGLLGFIELSIGRAVKAHAHLERAGRAAEQAGVREPWFLRFYIDDVEALLALDDVTA